jgi:hypothetical protein
MQDRFDSQVREGVGAIYTFLRDNSALRRPDIRGTRGASSELAPELRTEPDANENNVRGILLLQLSITYGTHAEVAAVLSGPVQPFILQGIRSCPQQTLAAKQGRLKQGGLHWMIIL